MGYVFIAAALAIGCGMVGVALSGGRRARFLVPVGGALLAGVALFGLLPELIHESGWVVTLALALVGYLIPVALEHFGYPVCPSCSHEEVFPGVLVAATAVHAFVDGWGMVATRNHGLVSGTITGAILLHKIPEGLALGSMLRAATRRGRHALALCVLAELPTVAGGLAGWWAAPGNWVNFPLALASGVFLFLGLHALRPVR